MGLVIYIVVPPSITGTERPGLPLRFRGRASTQWLFADNSFIEIQGAIPLMSDRIAHAVDPAIHKICHSYVENYLLTLLTHLKSPNLTFPQTSTPPTSAAHTQPAS